MKLVFITDFSIEPGEHNRSKTINYSKLLAAWLKSAGEIYLFARPKAGPAIGAFAGKKSGRTLHLRKLYPLEKKSLFSPLKKTLHFFKTLRQIRRDGKKCDHLVIHYSGFWSRISVILLPLLTPARKTVIYDKNWGVGKRRPQRDRLVRFLLRRRFWTRNATVLTYGNWREKNPAIQSNFLPVYGKSQSPKPEQKESSGTIRFLHVDGLHPEFQPMLACVTIRRLAAGGYPVALELCGTGPERDKILDYTKSYDLSDRISLHPPISSKNEAETYRRFHFLFYLRRDVAWPDEMIHAMWWGCLPVATPVGCIPDLLGNNQERGVLVYPHAEIIAANLKAVLNKRELYSKKSEEAMGYSRQFSEEAYREKIAGLLGG